MLGIKSRCIVEK